MTKPKAQTAASIPGQKFPQPSARRRAEPTDAPPRPRALKVRAIKEGYYDDKLRRVGDVFLIDATPKRHNDPTRLQNFSEKWMERVDAETPERLTSNNDVIRQQHDALQAAKAEQPTGDADPLGLDE